VFLARDGIDILMPPIVVANIYCPFGFRVHPRLDEIAGSSIAWLGRCGLVPDEPGLARFRAAHVPHLMCYARPEAGVEELLWSAKLLCWGVALDDLVDHQLWREPLPHVRAAIRQCASVLAVDGAVPIDQLRAQPAPGRSLILALHELWTELVARTEPGWRARLARDLESYLLSQDSEVENRIARQTPDLKTYLVLRRSTGMEPALLDLVEYDLGLWLPPEVVASPELQALRRAAEDYVDWVNDLYSWNKERLVGDPHNIVAVLQHHERCELPDAVERTCRMIASAARSVLEMGRRLPDVVPEHSLDLERYTASLQHWLGGYCRWYGITRRYDVPAGPASAEPVRPLIKPRLVDDDRDRGPVTARPAARTKRR
jgi:Terpene synthase family 2, C-terminal metal binding